MTKNRKIDQIKKAIKASNDAQYEMYHGYKRPPTPEPSEWEKNFHVNDTYHFVKYDYVNDEGDMDWVFATHQDLKNLIDTELVWREKKLRERVGMLRQWLNEDRIKDAKYFVTNEQIERWLDITLSEVGEKREEVGKNAGYNS